MASEQEHEKFWMNPKYLTDSIRELSQTMCEIRNAIILSGLTAGENSDVRSQAKSALELLAREKNLLKP